MDQSAQSDETSAIRESSIKETINLAEQAGQRLRELDEGSPNYVGRYEKIFEIVEGPPENPNRFARDAATTLIFNFELNLNTAAKNVNNLIRTDSYQEYLLEIAGETRKINAFLQKDPEEVMKRVMAITTNQISAAGNRKGLGNRPKHGLAGAPFTQNPRRQSFINETPRGKPRSIHSSSPT